MRVYQKDAVVVKLGLTAFDCPRCGMIFAITPEFEQRRRRDGATFYCPSGHPQEFSPSELEKAQREADAAQERARIAEARVKHERDQRKATERSLSATRGQVTKLRKRAQAGVCPCCTRHFTDLERHMKSKHPDTRLAGEGANDAD